MEILSTIFSCSDTLKENKNFLGYSSFVINASLYQCQKFDIIYFRFQIVPIVLPVSHHYRSVFLARKFTKCKQI